MVNLFPARKNKICFSLIVIFKGNSQINSFLSNNFLPKQIPCTIALLRSSKILTFNLEANHLVNNGGGAATAVLAVA